MSDTITIRRAAQIAAKKLPLKSEKRIAEACDMAGFTLAEAYKAGAEEAQHEILTRFNVLLMRAAAPSNPADSEPR